MKFIQALSIITASSLSSVDAQSLRLRGGHPSTNLPSSLVSKLDTPTGQLTVHERAGLVEELTESLQDNLAELSKLDLSAFPHAKSLVDKTRNTVEGAYKSIADAKYFITSSAGELESGNGVTSELGNVDYDINAADTQHQHHAQQQSKNHGKKEGTTHRDHTFADRGRFHSSTRAQTHTQKLHEAILKGDQHFVNGMIDSLNAKIHHQYGGHGRRAQTQVSKETQCERLVQCASRMSLYDLFVYYYSDDIDPTTGEVDSSIIHFDEGSILDKRDEIQNLINMIGGDFTSNHCDNLLQEFHRSIEIDGIPEWEGATVSQICLAEGTTVFVKLDDVVKTILSNLPEPINNLPDTLQDTYDEYVRIYEEIVTEPLKCAEDAFFDIIEEVSTNVFSERFAFQKNNQPPSLNDIELNNYAFPYDIDQNARNEHGQLLYRTNQETVIHAFKTKEISDVDEEVCQCMADYIEEEDDTLSYSCEDSPKELYVGNSPVPEELKLEAFRNCAPIYGKVVQKSLELVFGDRPSPGYICGVKEAVQDGKSLPGSCCLDAPYQLGANNWGFAYDCSQNCQNEGPLFSGMSKEACDIHGGTFCPVTDCKELKTCVEDHLNNEETNDKFPAFLDYIRSAPIVNNTANALECGKTREYFGFQDTFVNDRQICEDISQLKFSRNFDILNEFFSQGEEGQSDATTDVPKVAPPGVPSLLLNEPSREDSSQKTVINGKKWRSSNFAIERAASTLEFLTDLEDKVKCPSDPTTILENACKALKTVIGVKSRTAQFLLEKAFAISDFTYGERAELGNKEPIEIYENTAAVFDNMEKTGQYLQERFTALNNFIDGEFGLLMNDRKDGKLDRIDAKHEVLTNEINAVKAAVDKDSLTVQVEVAEKQGITTLLVLSQYHGELTNDREIFIDGYDGTNEQVFPIDFRDVSLGKGKNLVKFDSTQADFFFVKVQVTEKDFFAERSILLENLKDPVTTNQASTFTATSPVPTTMAPTPAPSPEPTPEPTTESPTVTPGEPTASPTFAPTPAPTPFPTNAPMVKPLTNDNIGDVLSDWFNSEEEKEAVEALYGPIGTWDTSRVTNMLGLFQNRTSFNEDLTGWDTSSVTNMQDIFNGATSFNGDISSFDTSQVINMNRMFKDAASFNQTVSGFDTSKVTGMSAMFDGATSFNRDVSNIDTSKVRSMGAMFRAAKSFNQDVSNFDTSEAVMMNNMFNGAESFNQGVSTFDTSNVVGMIGMFYGATSFNHDVSGFDTSKVTTMTYMFTGATSFNQDVSSFNTSNVIGMYAVFNGATSFDQTFCWNLLPDANVRAMFCGSSGRFDSGCATDDQILDSCGTLPLTDANIHQTVNDWFEVNKFTTERTFGPISDWDTSRVTNVQGLFQNRNLFNERLAGWDTSSVTNMQDMFNGAESFNQDIAHFDTSQVTNMNGMFFNAKSFNQDVSNFDTANAIDMANMFKGATDFNKDVNDFDTSKVKTTESMFEGATSFNKDVFQFNTLSVTNMKNMFKDATDFNRVTISNTFVTSSVTNMEAMFEGATAFNKDVSNLDTSRATSMKNMFKDATSFNSDGKQLCWTLLPSVDVTDMFCKSSGDFTSSSDCTSRATSTQITNARLNCDFGSSCTSGSDCDSGLCVKPGSNNDCDIGNCGDQGRCNNRCTDQSGCGSGFYCDTGLQWCVLQKDQGSSCSRSFECKGRPQLKKTLCCKKVQVDIFKRANRCVDKALGGGCL